MTRRVFASRRAWDVIKLSIAGPRRTWAQEAVRQYATRCYQIIIAPARCVRYRAGVTCTRRGSGNAVPAVRSAARAHIVSRYSGKIGMNYRVNNNAVIVIVMTIITMHGTWGWWSGEKNIQNNAYCIPAEALALARVARKTSWTVVITLYRVYNVCATTTTAGYKQTKDTCVRGLERQRPDATLLCSVYTGNTFLEKKK